MREHGLRVACEFSDCAYSVLYFISFSSFDSTYLITTLRRFGCLLGWKLFGDASDGMVV